ncbi:MAG TPA: nuclear transport factor 2 family protein [Cyclobacteriaceae bacterium]|nr:nuclear transport factor 2 family protein [Cyclobacteriaceae bacterium]
MHRNIIFTSVLCASLFISVSVSAQKGRWASSDDNLAMELIAKEKMWAESACSPQPGLKDVFADDFQGTAIDGARYGKDQAMSTDVNNLDRQCRLGDVKIQFFGEVVATAYGSESTIRKGADGKEYKRCLVWTDTWLKRDGKWQIIAAQDNVVECPK